MRNLLAIESQALQNTDLINGLQIDRINTIQRAVSKNEMSKINNSRKLSKIMLESYEYFKTSGKSILAENGVFWTAEDFGQKIFGFQKSYFMRICTELFRLHQATKPIRWWRSYTKTN